MKLKKLASHAPVHVTAHFTAGEAADKQFFVADRAYEVVEVSEVHRIAGAGSTTAMIEKCASGTAPGSGTDLLAAAFATDSTADTPVVKTVSGGGIVAAPTRYLARGDSLAVDFTGTMTAYEGVICVVLLPLRASQRPY